MPFRETVAAVGLLATMVAPASDWYRSSTVIPYSGAVAIAEFDFGYRHNSGPARAFHVRAVRGVPREPTG